MDLAVDEPMRPCTSHLQAQYLEEEEGPSVEDEDAEEEEEHPMIVSEQQGIHAPAYKEATWTKERVQDHQKKKWIKILKTKRGDEGIVMGVDR